MKAIDVVKIMAVGMEILSKSDIRTKDYRYINLYEDYCRMRSEGHKYEYAVKRMEKKDEAGRPVPITPLTKEQVSIIMKESGFTLSEKNVVWDAVYVANMCAFDFLTRSVPDERHLALFVKDVIDDPDAEEGYIFNRWYADSMFMDNPVDWDEMI